MILSVRIWWAQLRLDYLRRKTDWYRRAAYEFAHLYVTTRGATDWAHANLMCLLTRKKN